MLDSILGTEMTIQSFLICTAVSLVLGILGALVGMYRSKSSRSFAVTLAILPAVVQVMIFLVNGSIGAGIAVAGAFSLVRFRSAPGSAREIAAIFTAMAVGLATGMGYVLLACVFFAVVSAVTLLLVRLSFGGRYNAERILRVTIPEGLDYDGLFDDILGEYAAGWSLDRVRTVNMGTLYELQFRIRLRGETVPRAMLDAIRCRNGNLDVVCARELERDSL